MAILGIDAITYGVEDLAASRKFFLDWGLTLAADHADAVDFTCENGCGVHLRRANDATLPPAIEPGSTIREVVWGVESKADLDRIRKALAGSPGYGEHPLVARDPNGLQIRFQVTQKRKIDAKGSPVNTWDTASRVDQPSAFYDRAKPIEVGHVVFFTGALEQMVAFYRDTLGFSVSDSYPGRGVFFRASPDGGHHDLFILGTGKPGLNHVAYAVRDIHEVFGGGLHISRCGWETQLGPGRHPISSAYFWYVKNPAGALAEYYADEDVLTANWKPREFTPGPTVFAEWAIDGGIDGNTRRQIQAKAPDGKFMTERR